MSTAESTTQTTEAKHVQLPATAAVKEATGNNLLKYVGYTAALAAAAGAAFAAYKFLSKQEA